MAPALLTDLCLVGDTHKELDNDETVRRVNPVFRGESPPRLEQWEDCLEEVMCGLRPDR